MKIFPVTVPQFGAAPYAKVVIEYPSGTVTYTDTNKLLEIGEVVVSKRVDNYGEASGVTFTLDDSDGSIKTRIDNTNLVNIPVTVYFVLGVNEMAVLKGKLTGEVSWDESQRRATMSAEGITATEAPPTLPGIEELPLAFGTPIKVKAIQIQRVPQGRGVGYVDQDATSFYVDGGTDFPQNTLINIDVWISNEPVIVNSGGSIQTFSNDSPLRMTGVMVGTTFTPSAKNIAIYSGLSIGARDMADPDNADNRVMWLNTDNAYIGGLWVKFDNSINYCVAQRGRKCFFWSPITVGYTTIYEVAGTVRTSWGGQYTHPQYGVSDNVDKWRHWPDCTIKQALADPTEVYCYNGIAGSTVLKVYAKRRYNGETILAEVPSSYYTKDNAYAYGGSNRSVIKFLTPLRFRGRENWDDDSVYVTAASTIGKNTVDQLEYIVDNYTALAVDAVSFAAVKTKVQYYPSNFVVSSGDSPIRLIQDIAYQARIGVQIDAGTVKLRYLSEVPASDLTITDEDIKLSSITLGFPNPDDLVTEIDYQWRRNYYEDPVSYVYRNNVSLYGLKQDTFSMSIYNDESLVKKSADWIGNRRSNVWRKMKFKTMLNALGLETNDCINIQCDSLSTNAIRSDVDSVALDMTEYTYEIGLTLASKSGIVDGESRVFEDLSYWQITELTAAPPAPESGLIETDFVVPVDPEKNQPNPNEGQKLRIKIENEDTAEEIPDVTRDKNYVFYVSWLDSNDNLITGQSQPFLITLTDTGADNFDPTITPGIPVGGTIGSNGIGSAPFAVTGGTGEVTRKIEYGWGTKQNGLHAKADLKILPEPTPRWITWQDGVERDELFDVSIVDMLPSTVYNVSLLGPGDDDLANGAGLVTTITSDATGQYTGQWKFSGGTMAVANYSVVLEHASYEYSSEIIIVISTGAANLVYKHTGTLTVGSVVEAPSWTAATSASETVGVVVKSDAGISYIVVRGLCCITGLTENTKYFVTTGGILDTTDTGLFVLKSYMNDLCWIGGGGDAGTIAKLKDVTLTSLANKDVLVYDSTATKWKNRQLSTATDADRLVATDAIKDKAVTFAKIQEVLPLTVMGNFGAVNSTPLSITATAVGQVLMYKDAVLQWSTIANANIAAGAAISHTKIDFLGWSGAATPGTLTAGTGLTGTAFNGSVNQTWSVNFGSGAGTVCQGNDGRLSDARTPLSHSIMSHTLSGATAGQVMLAVSSTTYGFIAMSGDATINASGVLTIATAAVSLAKMADLAAGTVIGRSSSTGVPQAVTSATGNKFLRNNAGALSWDTLAAADLAGGATNTYVLTISGGVMSWAAPSGGTLAGDVSGAPGSNTVDKIKGIAVSIAAITLGDTFGARLAFFNESSDTIIFSDKIGATANGSNGALLTAYSKGLSSFAIGEIAPVAAAETGYLLGIDTDLSVANAKPKWLRAIKLGKGEGAASATVGSILVVTAATGSHAIINGSGLSIKKAAETTAKVAISEDGIMALGNSGSGVGASLQVFNKTTGNYRLEMGASNFRKINANGTYTAMTVKTFTTTSGTPAETGELGDVVLVY